MSRAVDHTVRKNAPLPAPPTSEVDVRYESRVSSVYDEATDSATGEFEHHRGQQTNPTNGADLNESLASVYDQLRKTKIELNNAVEALASLHSSDPFRLPDDHIARTVKELRSDIRDWSRRVQRQSKKPGIAKTIKDTIMKGEQCAFALVTNHYQHYLISNSDADLSVLVQAFVWKILLAEVFDHLLWLGGPCKLLKSTGIPCRILRDFNYLRDCCGDRKHEGTENHYYQWRAQTTRLLAGSSQLKLHQPCIDHNVKSVTKAISSKLKEYPEKEDMIADNDNNNRGPDDLASIVKTAINLDLVLWQQKAVFKFEAMYSDHPQLTVRRAPWLFQASSMTSGLGDQQDGFLMTRNHGNPCTVRLFTAPALWKRGTSEGDSYDQQYVICKAVVDCHTEIP